MRYFIWKLELVSDILWVIAVKEKFDKRIELTDKIDQIDLIYCFKGNTAKKKFYDFNNGIKCFEKTRSGEMKK